MPFARLMRRSLIGFVALVFLAVAFNYVQTRRTRLRVAKQPTQMLGSEMIRSAESVEYSEHHNGSLRFRIHAERLLETKLGRSFLQGISAYDFNPDGSIHNEIRSHKAEYDREGKLVDFSGDVRMYIGDELELRTNSLHYDLNTNIGVTEDRLEFVSHQATGLARGIRYDQNQQSLELNSAVDFNLFHDRAKPDGSVETETLHVTSERANYREETSHIRFQGKARLDFSAAMLSGDEISTGISSDQKRVTSLTSVGNSSYISKVSPEQRSLTGERMVFGIGESTGALEKIDVLGEAVFSSISWSAEEELRGSEIHLVFESDTEMPKLVQGRTKVLFRMKSAAGQTVVSGDELDAVFVNGHSELENVCVRKRARVSMESGLDSESNVLDADEIRLDFHKSDRSGIKKLEAAGSVQWISSTWRQNESRLNPARSLKASNLETVYSEEGFLDSGIASGHVELVLNPQEATAGSQIRRLSADLVDFCFFPRDNRLREMNAEGDVRVNHEHREGSHAEEFQTSSDNMRATFALENGNSTVADVSQWGNFLYEDGSRSAAAGRCDYRARTESLVLEGSPEVSDKTGSTTGDRMNYDRREKILSVYGRVRSTLGSGLGARAVVLSGASSAAVVMAGEMHYWTDEARVRYLDNVRVLSEGDQLEAAVVEIIEDGERVEAQGGVTHRVNPRRSGAPDLQANTAGKDGTILILSSSMKYSRASDAISYAGSVSLHSAEVDLSSESLDAEFEKGGTRIEHATARGKVFINQGARKCKGEVADYYLKAGRFVVVGNPAEIYDPARGRSSARRLTSYTTNDRILLESQW